MSTSPTLGDSADPADTAASLALDVSHLRAAWDAASRSSESSASCWTQLTTCLEQGRGGDDEPPARDALAES